MRLVFYFLVLIYASASHSEIPTVITQLSTCNLDTELDLKGPTQISCLDGNLTVKPDTKIKNNGYFLGIYVTGCLVTGSGRPGAKGLTIVYSGPSRSIPREDLPLDPTLLHIQAQCPIGRLVIDQPADIPSADLSLRISLQFSARGTPFSQYFTLSTDTTLAEKFSGEVPEFSGSHYEL